jgi:hypothetical protein
MVSGLECAIYDSQTEWEKAWFASSGRLKRRPVNSFLEIASAAACAISDSGFRLFDNGGSPLTERRVRHLRQEILFMPAPRMTQRAGLPFTVRVHVSSREVARVRSRYWRPACRAPQVVASGNLGQLQFPPRHHIFFAAQRFQCVEQIARMLKEDALPWFDKFGSPLEMRADLYSGSIALVDDSTATELLLSEFDRFEAREFVRFRTQARILAKGPIAEREGYDLASDRLAPISVYYKL